MRAAGLSCLHCMERSRKKKRDEGKNEEKRTGAKKKGNQEKTGKLVQLHYAKNIITFTHTCIKRRKFMKNYFPFNGYER